VSGWAMNGALKVIDEDLFQVHEWIESCLKLSSHVKGADSKAIGKYMTLVEFVPPATSIGVE